MGEGRRNKAGKRGRSYEADDLGNQAKSAQLYFMGNGEPLKAVTRSVCLERLCWIDCGLLEW